MADLIIRQEEERDYRAVYNLIKEAFASAEHADGNEQELVEALRRRSSFIPQLALVAETGGSMAGYILLTKANAGGRTVLVLAPLAVKPQYQRQGIGAALINEAHKKAQALGYDYIVVLGSEAYYPRFGYIQAGLIGINTPAGFPPANFMAVKLRENAPQLSGEIVYPPEFGL